MDSFSGSIPRRNRFAVDFTAREKGYNGFPFAAIITQYVFWIADSSDDAASCPTLRLANLSRFFFSPRQRRAQAPTASTHSIVRIRSSRMA